MYCVEHLYLLFAQAESSGRQIPPTTRAIILMALLGIALLGMLIVVMILLGGHWVRRQGTYRRGPAVPPDLILEKERPPELSNLPDGEHSTGDTSVTNNTLNS